MDSRVMEIEAEVESLTREGERVLAHLESLKAQFDRGLISRPLYEKTVEEAKVRLASIDKRIPELLGEKEKLAREGGGRMAARGPVLEPPVARPPPPARAQTAPVAVPAPAAPRTVEEALVQARAAVAEVHQLKSVLGPSAARLAALEDKLSALSPPDLRDQVRQMAERQERLEAAAKEFESAARAELRRLSDILKPLPETLEKMKEDVSTTRIEIKALKYEAEALNTLQEDRLRALEQALSEMKKK